MKIKRLQKYLSVVAARFFILALIFLLASCTVVPRKIRYHDDKCHIFRTKVDLELVSAFSNKASRPAGYLVRGMICSGSDCGGLAAVPLLGSAIVLPISAIASGSVAMIGNIFYAFTEPGIKCVEPQNQQTNDAIIDILIIKAKPEVPEAR